MRLSAGIDCVEKIDKRTSEKHDLGFEPDLTRQQNCAYHGGRQREAETSLEPLEQGPSPSISISRAHFFMSKTLLQQAHGKSSVHDKMMGVQLCDSVVVAESQLCRFQKFWQAGREGS